ncbi:MAG: type VI secretion system baseplate subunit TssE [Actinobacteria bacterium]|nr:type VI secretion system baseplate subunit TssE [Actinomycetota bacterium]
MAKTEIERAVQLGLIDRLIDHRPDSRVEPVMSRQESVRRLRSAVRRDLEWLLNTNRSIESVPESCAELRDSLFFYGLPDVNSLTLDNAQDEERLLRSLESSIERFEPRLTRVRVIAFDRVSKQRASVQFRVEAVLLIEPSPERISFDTVLEIAMGSYTVKEDQGA